MWDDSDYPKDFREVMKDRPSNLIHGVMLRLKCKERRARKMVDAYKLHKPNPMRKRGRPFIINPEMYSRPEFAPLRNPDLNDAEAAKALFGSAGVVITARTVANARMRMQMPNRARTHLCMRAQFLHEVLSAHGKLHELVRRGNLLHFDQLFLRCRLDGVWEKPWQPSCCYRKGPGTCINCFAALWDDSFAGIRFSDKFFSSRDLERFLVKQEFRKLLKRQHTVAFCDRATFQDGEKGRHWICEHLCRLLPGWPPDSSGLLPVERYFECVLARLAERPGLTESDVKQVFQDARDEFAANGFEKILDVFAARLAAEFPGITEAQLPFTEEIDAKIIALRRQGQDWGQIGLNFNLDGNIIKQRYRFLQELAALAELCAEWHAESG
jgi:hypothetical protein